MLALSTVVTPTGCNLCTVHYTPVHSHSPRWLHQAQVALSLFRHVREIRFFLQCALHWLRFPFEI